MLNEGFYKGKTGEPITKLDDLITALNRFRGCGFDVVVKQGLTDWGVVISVSRETDESQQVVIRIPSAEAVPRTHTVACTMRMAAHQACSCAVDLPGSALPHPGVL